MVEKFPSHFALAASARSEAASSASKAAEGNAPAGGAVGPYPQPHHIDARRGASNDDIHYIADQVAASTRRLKSMVFNEVAIYRNIVERLLENEREHVAISRGASVESFTYTLLDIMDDFDRALSDLSSDVQADLERGLKSDDD